MMFDTSSMKDVLDRVASSPDQRVRGMAIRYKECQQEMERLSEFFALYATTAALAVAAPTNGEMQAQPAKMRQTRGRRPANGSESFGPLVADIIDTYGRPMPLPEIYGNYQQKNPDHVVTFETFRQKIIKHKELFCSVRGQGYWLVNKDVPSHVAA